MEQLTLPETNGMLNDLAAAIARWREYKGFETKWSNVPEKLMLIVTELSEAMEAYRFLPSAAIMVLEGDVPFQLLDEDSGTVSEFEMEIADAFIRLFDLAGSLSINLDRVIADKMAFNQNRPVKHGKER